MRARRSAGISPEMTLNSVVFPAPFGPEDGAPLAGRDVEVDVAHGVEAAEPPADPPQAEDRGRHARSPRRACWRSILNASRRCARAG